MVKGRFLAREVALLEDSGPLARAFGGQQIGGQPIPYKTLEFYGAPGLIFLLHLSVPSFTVFVVPASAILCTVRNVHFGHLFLHFCVFLGVPSP